MSQKFANAARGYLSADLSSAATTITLAGDGSLFPVANGTDWFKAVLQDSNGIEIVHCTAHDASSNSFTVTRGQEGTTARAFATGSVFGQRVTAGDMAFPAALNTGITLTPNRITQSLTIPDGSNALLITPVEVDPSVTVTGLGNSTLRGI